MSLIGAYSVKTMNYRLIDCFDYHNVHNVLWSNQMVI